LNFILFSLKGITLFHLTQKFQKIINVLDNIRAYPKSQKTHFGTLVLLGLTPKHPRKPKWLFADLGRLLLIWAGYC
jgi:hypothetical protein